MVQKSKNQDVLHFSFHCVRMMSGYFRNFNPLSPCSVPFWYPIILMKPQLKSAFEVKYRHLRHANLKIFPNHGGAWRFIIGGTWHEFIAWGTLRVRGTWFLWGDLRLLCTPWVTCLISIINQMYYWECQDISPIFVRISSGLSGYLVPQRKWTPCTYLIL